MFLQIKSGEQCRIKDHDKSNIFTLGLILLKTIYGENLEIKKVYSLKNLSLNNEYLKEMIINLKNLHFSKLFVTCIEYMLNEIESLRMSSLDILKFIGSEK